MDHLTDAELVQFREGDLPEAELSRIAGHLNVCDADCLHRLEGLKAKSSEPPPLRDSPAQPGAPGGNGAPGAGPATIGKYLVVEELGEGGQAVVYRAVHPALKKEVAVKLSRRPLARGPADHELLVAEGKLLAELDHPNLARVYDLDLHEGCPFLVMEYVRGPDLQQYAEQERPTPRQAAALVAGVARALGVAHGRGITHQDIKPSNILIDEAGRPRLIDFGLARLRRAWADEAAQPDGGTPAYMAPEQARGETGRVGRRSDLFALGAVLYHLLTGKPPFEDLDRAARCDFDKSALRGAGVPRWLEAICLRAMAPRPEDRYARAEDLAGALDRVVGKPKPPRAALAGAGFLFLALLAVLGVSWPPQGRPGRGGDPGHTPPMPPGPVEEVERLRFMKIEYRDGQFLRPKRDYVLVGSLDEKQDAGDDALVGRLGDLVRVSAQFRSPSLWYLLALTPDGQVLLLDPPGEDRKPVKKQEVRYPVEGGYFRLEERVGLQAFVLVVSATELPPYARWEHRLDKEKWRHFLRLSPVAPHAGALSAYYPLGPVQAVPFLFLPSQEPIGLWRYDHRQLLPPSGKGGAGAQSGPPRPGAGRPDEEGCGAEDPEGDGEEAATDVHFGKAQSFLDACRFLKKAPGVRVYGMAFPVEARD
jgi:tRNA A-37 threonylcarbamoyl transferase component Bud32